MLPLQKMSGRNLRVNFSTRDVLRDAALRLLAEPGYVGDVGVELLGEQATSRRHVVSCLWRLLDDLGWDAGDRRAAFELAQLDDNVARALFAIRINAKTSVGLGVMLELFERADEGPAERRARIQKRAYEIYITSTCDELLGRFPESVLQLISAELDDLEEAARLTRGKVLLADAREVEYALPRAHREELRDAVLACLSQPTTAFASVIDAVTSTPAQQLRERVEAAWRLLDDLGWRTDDPRDYYELTLTASQLATVLRWVKETAHQTGSSADDWFGTLLRLLPPEVVAVAAEKAGE